MASISQTAKDIAALKEHARAAFMRHDPQKNGCLDEAESNAFFAHYVALFFRP